MEFFATFPLTGAKRKTTTLTNEHPKKPKISCCAVGSETYDGKASEGDDEAEYYEESEDEDGDGDGQDCNEDKQQHGEDENEQGSEKAKEYQASQEAYAHNFDRVKLHDVQIRSLRDCCARVQESYRIEQQARMDLQLTVDKLMQRVGNLEETIRNQEERTNRNKETIQKCKMRLATLEREIKIHGECLWKVATVLERLQTAVFGPR
ncbi:hypothetical protein GGI42DRAFT_332741 [Trichoderma sp. SZMC 28013]